MEYIPPEPVDLLIIEMVSPGLLDEMQSVVVEHLAPYVRSSGFMIPERVDVERIENVLFTTIRVFGGLIITENESRHCCGRLRINDDS